MSKYPKPHISMKEESKMINCPLCNGLGVVDDGTKVLQNLIAVGPDYRVISQIQKSNNEDALVTKVF